jgi:hypothetical protein
MSFVFLESSLKEEHDPIMRSLNMNGHSISEFWRRLLNVNLPFSRKVISIFVRLRTLLHSIMIPLSRNGRHIS